MLNEKLVDGFTCHAVDSVHAETHIVQTVCTARVRGYLEQSHVTPSTTGDIPGTVACSHPGL
jgi:hypothetical protein